MKILAIDTASNICSVAILENDTCQDEINLNNGKTHSENLMPIVAEILSRNNMKLSKIDLISCCVGPGSFTGIRIGVASVKAMAEASKLPVIGVNALETLAQIDSSEAIKVSLIDARNNQVYCGVFDRDYQLLEELMADDITTILESLKKYDDLICIGDGAVFHKALIEQELPQAKFSEQNEQKTSLGGKVAYQKYQNNEIQSADTIVPLYLRKSQAERMKNKGK